MAAWPAGIGTPRTGLSTEWAPPPWGLQPPLALCDRIVNAGEDRYQRDLQRAVDDVCADGGIVFLPPLNDGAESYFVPRPPLRITRPDVAILGGGLQSRVTMSMVPARGLGLNSPAPVGIEVDAPAGGPVVLGSFWLDYGIPPEPRPDLLPPLVTGIHVAETNRAAVLLRDLSIKTTLISPTQVIGVNISKSKGPVTLHTLRIAGRAGDPGKMRGVTAEASPSETLTIRLIDCCLTGGLVGVSLQGSVEANVHDCIFENNTEHGMSLRDVRFASIIGTRFERNDTVQLLVLGSCDSVHVEGCYFTGKGNVDGIARPISRMGVGVLNTGRTSLVGNTLQWHRIADVYVAKNAGVVFPAPREISGQTSLRLNETGRVIDTRRRV